MTDSFFPGLLEETMNDGDVDLPEAGERRIVEKNQEEINVGGIGLDCVFGQSPLGDQVVQKGFSDSGKMFGEL